MVAWLHVPFGLNCQPVANNLSISDRANLVYKYHQKPIGGEYRLYSLRHSLRLFASYGEIPMHYDLNPKKENGGFNWLFSLSLVLMTAPSSVSVNDNHDEDVQLGFCATDHCRPINTSFYNYVCVLSNS